jgi:hypothetical protein
MKCLAEAIAERVLSKEGARDTMAAPFDTLHTQDAAPIPEQCNPRVYGDI